MTKSNHEQDKINRERLVDIVLVIQYMKELDISKEFFTDRGEGFIEGLVSSCDEIKFIHQDKYDKLLSNNKSLKDEIKRLKQNKKRWF